MDRLLDASFSFSVPYMDVSMSHEDVKDYIVSFANDKRIPPTTVFNVFQTTLKLFNGGGGRAPLSRWNTEGEASMPKVLMDDVDIVCFNYWLPVSLLICYSLWIPWNGILSPTFLLLIPLRDKPRDRM
jgi:hypothetical protein